MRTRKQIEGEWERNVTSVAHPRSRDQEAILREVRETLKLELLLDIRELLQKLRK